MLVGDKGERESILYTNTENIGVFEQVNSLELCDPGDQIRPVETLVLSRRYLKAKPESIVPFWQAA
jgi:hypothetical protein